MVKLTGKPLHVVRFKLKEPSRLYYVNADPRAELRSLVVDEKEQLISTLAGTSLLRWCIMVNMSWLPPNTAVGKRWVFTFADKYPFEALFR